MRSNFLIVVLLLSIFIVPTSAHAKEGTKDDGNEFSKTAKEVINCKTKNPKLKNQQGTSGVRSHLSYTVTIETLDALKDITSCTAIEAQTTVIVAFKIRDYVFGGSNSCYFNRGEGESNVVGHVGIGDISELKRTPSKPLKADALGFSNFLKNKLFKTNIKTARLQCGPSKADQEDDFDSSYKLPTDYGSDRDDVQNNKQPQYNFGVAAGNTKYPSVGNLFLADHLAKTLKTPQVPQAPNVVNITYNNPPPPTPKPPVVAVSKGVPITVLPTVSQPLKGVTTANNTGAGAGAVKPPQVFILPKGAVRVPSQKPKTPGQIMREIQGGRPTPVSNSNINPATKADGENAFYGDKDPKEGWAEINGTSKIGDVSSIRVNPNPDIKSSGATAYEDGRLISFGDTGAKNPGVTTYNPGGVVQTPEDNFKSSNTDLENQFNKPNTGYNLTQARYQADIQGGQRNELSNYKKLIPKKEQIPPNTDFGSGGGGGFGGGSSGGSAGSSNLLNSLVGGFGSIAGKFLGQKIAGQGEQKPKTKTVERQKPVCFAFNASKNTIKEGETTELRWLMRFTDTVTITGLGTVPTVGKVTISPELEAGEIHKEYILTAKNRYGSITCPPVRITVLPEGESIDTQDFDSDVLMNCTNGSKAIVLWQCPIGTYKSVGSSTEHKAFNTLGRVEGAVVVEPDVPSTFVVRCNDEQNNEIGRNSCLVRLSGSTVQNGGNTNKNPNTCTLQANVIVDANEIQANTRATIRWESECVSSCKLRMFDIGGGAELAPQLGIQGKIVGNLISDTRFDLECKGFDGSTVGDSEVIRAI